MNTMGNSRQLSLKYVQKCPAWVPTRLESLWLHSVAKAQRRAAKAEKVILQARQYQNLELNSFQHQQELINYVAPLQAHRILEEPNMDSEVRLLQLAAHVTAGVADLFAIQWSDAEMGEKQSRVSNWWQMHATSFMISLVTSDPKKYITLDAVWKISFLLALCVSPTAPLIYYWVSNAYNIKLIQNYWKWQDSQPICEVFPKHILVSLSRSAEDLNGIFEVSVENDSHFAYKAWKGVNPWEFGLSLHDFGRSVKKATLKDKKKEKKTFTDNRTPTIMVAWNLGSSIKHNG